ncbi:MAG: sulfatase-like hydrolase/transferase [Acidobacteriota bacterium]
MALRYVVCRDDTLRVFRLVRSWKAHYPPGEIVLDMAEKWLSSQQDGPFFLYLQTSDPHWPYYSHNLGMIPEQVRKYEDKLIYVDLLGVDSAIQAAAIRTTPEFLNLVGRYDEELSYTDSLVSRLINFLQQTGRWENTLFILISDHGEEFLDHDRFSHGHDVWEELTHVPMLIKWPHRPAFSSLPESVSSRVGLIDLFPTLVDYLDLPKPRVSMKGTSFREILEKGDDPASKEPLFSESIFQDVIRGAYWEGNIKVRLEFSRAVPPLESKNVWVYDLTTDPEEKNPISLVDPSAVEIVLRGRNCFQEIWKLWPDKGEPKSKSAAKKDAKQPDKKSTLEKLKSLGYLK